MMEYEVRRALEWEKEWFAQNNGHDWAYVGKNPVQICRKCKKLWWEAEKICPGNAPERVGTEEWRHKYFGAKWPKVEGDENDA